MMGHRRADDLLALRLVLLGDSFTLDSTVKKPQSPLNCLFVDTLDLPVSIYNIHQSPLLLYIL